VFTGDGETLILPVIDLSGQSHSTNFVETDPVLSHAPVDPGNQDLIFLLSTPAAVAQALQRFQPDFIMSLKPA
jgi:hypothetical protein